MSKIIGVIQNVMVDRKDAKDVVLIDFWSPTCGPCLNLMPELQRLEQDGDVEVRKINVLEKPDEALDRGVMGLPNLQLYRNETKLAEAMHYMTYSELRTWIDNHK